MDWKRLIKCALMAIAAILATAFVLGLIVTLIKLPFWISVSVIVVISIIAMTYSLYIDEDI